MDKFNTVSGVSVLTVQKCKLLLSKSVCIMHSTDLLYDEVSVGKIYRTVFCESLRFFDRDVLLRLVYLVGDPVRGAVAYSFDLGVCRIISNREVEHEAYAAAVFSLLCDGRISEGERIEVVTEQGTFFASAARESVSLYA